MGSIGDSMLYKVCIGIPVRNGAKTITETLGSLITQDYQNIEIIICDNNSTDNTDSVIENFVLNNSRVPITCLQNPIDGTAEENWNYLLRNMPKHYDYYALYHADDLYDPELITKQLAVIKEGHVGAVFCTASLIDQNGENISNEQKHNPFLPKGIKQLIFDYNDLLNYTLKYYNFIKAPSFFFSKAILEDRLFFKSRFRSSADLDMWFRIAEKYRIAVINEPLLKYRISDTQGTALLSKGKVTEADYFTVMDFHLAKTNVYKYEMLAWYNAYRSINMVTRALNLCKDQQRKDAKSLLNLALKIQNIPYLLKISHGIRNFALGLALKMALSLRLELKLIKLINR